MEPWHIALLIKPLVAFVILVLIALPIRMAVKRWMPECKLKRILLFSWKV